MQHRIEMLHDATREAEAERKSHQDDQNKYSMSVAERNKTHQTQLENAKPKNQRLGATQANVAYRQESLEGGPMKRIARFKGFTISRITSWVAHLSILSDLTKTDSTE